MISAILAPFLKDHVGPSLSLPLCLSSTTTPSSIPVVAPKYPISRLFFLPRLLHLLHLPLVPPASLSSFLSFPSSCPFLLPS